MAAYNTRRSTRTREQDRTNNAVECDYEGRNIPSKKCEWICSRCKGRDQTLFFTNQPRKDDYVLYCRCCGLKTEVAVNWETLYEKRQAEAHAHPELVVRQGCIRCDGNKWQSGPGNQPMIPAGGENVMCVHCGKIQKRRLAPAPTPIEDDIIDLTASELFITHRIPWNPGPRDPTIPVDEGCSWAYLHEQ